MAKTDAREQLPRSRRLNGLANHELKLLSQLANEQGYKAGSDRSLSYSQTV